MEENIYEEKISKLKREINRLEMLNEIEQSDLVEYAQTVLEERFQHVVQKATNDFLDQFVEPAFKATADSLLVELGLEELPEEVVTHQDVLEQFLKAFQKDASKNQI